MTYADKGKLRLLMLGQLLMVQCIVQFNTNTKHVRLSNSIHYWKKIENHTMEIEWTFI